MARLTDLYPNVDSSNLNLTGVDVSKLPKIDSSTPSQFGKFLGKANSFLTGPGNYGSLIGSGLDLVGSFIKPPPGYSGKKGNVQMGMDKAWDVASNAVNAIPGVGTAIGVGMKALGVLNKGIQRLGGGTDGMTTADSILNSNFFGWNIGLINGIGGKKANTYTRNEELDAQSASGFGGFQALQTATSQGAGKKYGLFSSGARDKQNKLTEYTQGVKHTISGIVDYNTLNSLATAGTTAYTVQQQNTDLNGGIHMLRAARSGGLLSPNGYISNAEVIKAIKPIKKDKGFKQKKYNVFRDTTDTTKYDITYYDGKMTAIPSILSTRQKNGLDPIVTEDRKIVYMKPDGSLSDKPLKTTPSLYAKRGVELARKVVRKNQIGGVLEVVPREIANEEEALKYTEELYPFIQPYLDDVRVHDATNDPEFIEYVKSFKKPINIEFIDDEDTSYQIPSEKEYANPYPGKKTVVYQNLNGDRLNNAVAMDLISHYGRKDPTYKQLYDRALRLLMSGYSNIQMEAAHKLGEYLKNTKDSPYAEEFSNYTDDELGDRALDLSRENPEVNKLLQAFYMNSMDSVVRDLLSKDRDSYHETPRDAFREYATSPEIAQALRELIYYVKGESPMKITYFDTSKLKRGGKVEYRSIKETSTGQSIGIPTNITDNQKNGVEPIKTNSGRQVIMRKDGTVIYVEAARQMRPFLKKGGKMNVIPEGALHARKNHLTDVDDMYKAVTHKGIPVITIEDDGEVIQHAEVEHSEIIFTKEVTDMIEKYRKQGTDEAALACGKLLVKEILYNTDDRTGLIKTIK